MASQTQPRHENDGREADFCGTKEKRGKNEERDAILYPLSRTRLSCLYLTTPEERYL
jgi:hypothetical protein